MAVRERRTMLKTYFNIILAAAGAFLLVTATAQAQIIAFGDPVHAGNQNFPVNLGLDFSVNSPIVVTSLGAFDANADGIVGPISVAIFNRTTGLQVGPSVTISAGNPGDSRSRGTNSRR